MGNSLKTSRKISLLCLMLFGVCSAVADQTAGKFGVTILLINSAGSGSCTNQSQSDFSGTSVKVTCTPAQFVNIAPSSALSDVSGSSLLSASATSPFALTRPSNAAMVNSSVTTMQAGITGASSLLDATKPQKVAEVSYIDTATGRSVSAPFRADAQTSSVAVYSDLYAKTLRDSPQRRNTDTIPASPVEMFVVF